MMNLKQRSGILLFSFVLHGAAVLALRDRMLDAVHMADVDSVRELIEEMRSGVLSSAAPVSVTQVEKVHGRNCLMHCGLDPQSSDIRDVDLKCAAIAELLRDAGANLSHIDAHGWNAVAMGSVKGLSRFCEVLIDHGVNGDLPDDEGRTPLMKAINQGFLNVVNVLVKKGANVTRKDKNGWTCIHYAVRQAAGEGKFVAILDYILTHSKRHSLVNVKDNEGRTPLMYAAAQANLDIVDKLLLNGADPRIVDNAGRDAAAGSRSADVGTRLREWSIRLTLEEHSRWLESSAEDLDEDYSEESASDALVSSTANNEF
jgi:ankyrin repeat protein